MSEPLTAEEILRRTQGDKFDPNAAVLESERKELAARAKGTEFVAPAATPAVPVEQREKITKQSRVEKAVIEAATAPTADGFVSGHALTEAEIAHVSKKYDEAPTPSPLDIEATVKPIGRRR
jgi:hypothetical protein